MKKITLMLLPVILLAAGCIKHKVNPVLGAWNLTYSKTVVNDSVIRSFPSTYQGSQVKMWGDKYWMFTASFTTDTVSQDAFGGGTYSLDGIVYRETVVYHSSQDYIGQTLRMRIVVTGDTLIQAWPADDKGEIDKSNYTCEKYLKAR